MEDIELKKIGLNHLRNAERLAHLQKKGLDNIKYSAINNTYTITLVRYYKTSRIVDTYTQPTLCEAINAAYEVHGDANTN